MQTITCTQQFPHGIHGAWTFGILGSTAVILMLDSTDSEGGVTRCIAADMDMPIPVPANIAADAMAQAQEMGTGVLTRAEIDAFVQEIADAKAVRERERVAHWEVIFPTMTWEYLAYDDTDAPYLIVPSMAFDLLDSETPFTQMTDHEAQTHRIADGEMGIWVHGNTGRVPAVMPVDTRGLWTPEHCAWRLYAAHRTLAPQSALPWVWDVCATHGVQEEK